jgi:transitional endoplasmic reticulum ATPase
MADTNLEALLQALQATPGNEVLRAIVIDAALATENADAIKRCIELCGDGALDDPERRSAAARILDGAGEHALSLRFASDSSAAQLIAESQSFFDEGRRSDAIRAYERAIALDPLVEDPAFAAQLTGKVVSLGGARPRAYAGSANDETDAEDVVHALRPTSESVTFANVGGLDTVKQEIRRRIITPFLKPSLFQRFKRNAGGGILLYGPPGCGKTLLARATAGECGAKFYNVAITDILDMYIGESERKLHAIFETARRTAPAVLFFDEMEAIGGKRQHSREATSAKLVSQFLIELDGFAQNNQGILILGATNVPWAIDPAFRRPGRLDRVLFVPPPDAAARRAILSLLLQGRPHERAIEIDEIVAATSGYSGADLRNLIDTAADEAIEASIEQSREHAISITQLRAAARSVKPTTLEWLTTARNHARYSNQGGQYDDVLAFLGKMR